MAGDIYKTFYFDGKKVYCIAGNPIEESSCFILGIDDEQYFVETDNGDVLIDAIIDGERDDYDTIPISDLPSGDCIEVQVAKFIIQ